MLINKIAIIPARGGSKGLPGKNIKLLNGKPLIVYTIEAAIISGCFDKVIVSTDDEKIAEISQKFGAEIPFLRPKELASDTSNSIDVIKHALSFYTESNIVIKEFALLQPTSPLRDYMDIRHAYTIYQEKLAQAVVSVCETEHSPLWSNTLPPDLSLDKFLNANVINIRRQDLPIYYRLNGAIYIANTEFFLKNETFFGDGCFAYIMQQKNSVDIDTLIDFKMAEFLLSEDL